MKILVILLIVGLFVAGLLLIAAGAEKTITVTVDSAVIGLWMWAWAAALSLHGIAWLVHAAWRRWVRP